MWEHHEVVEGRCDGDVGERSLSLRSPVPAAQVQAGQESAYHEPGAGCDGEVGHPNATTAGGHARTVDRMAESPARCLEGDCFRDHMCFSRIISARSFSTSLGAVQKTERMCVGDWRARIHSAQSRRIVVSGGALGRTYRHCITAPLLW
jgi:hypothetical protein